MITLSELTQPVTKLQLNNLISNNSVQVGQNYLITDSTQADEGIIVEGETSTSVSLEGSGIFLNADYNNNGKYTNVPSYSGINLGVWASNIPSVSIGDVVIYSGLNYINLTGSIGTAPATDFTNWQFLNKSVDEGYIREIDFVTYDQKNDILLSRKDKRNNYIERASVGIALKDNPIYSFQWGNDLYYENKITGRSKFDGTNARNSFNNNTLNNGEYTSEVDYSIVTPVFSYNVIEELGEVKLKPNCYGEIKGNYIKGGKPGSLELFAVDISGQILYNTINLGSVTLDKVFSQFSYNVVSNGSNVIIDEITINGVFTQNTITNFCLLEITFLDEIYRRCFLTQRFIKYDSITKLQEGKTLLGVNSNLSIELDMNDPLIFDNVTGRLTIPLKYRAFGDITLNNCSGKIIKSIDCNNINILRRFYPENTFTVDFENITVGSIFPKCLLCNGGTITNTLTGRTNGSDYIEYGVSGQIPNEVNVRTNLVLLV